VPRAGSAAGAGAGAEIVVETEAETAATTAATNAAPVLADMLRVQGGTVNNVLPDADTGRVTYVPKFLTADETRELAELLRAHRSAFSAEKVRRGGRVTEVRNRRTLYYYSGSPYGYAGMKRTDGRRFGAGTASTSTSKFDRAVERLRARVSERLGFQFDTCIVNHYVSSGADPSSAPAQLGWHADDTSHLDLASPIAGVTIGATRPIVFRRKTWKRGDPKYEVLPRSGSLFTMFTPMQQHWVHAVPTRKTSGDRWSFTFRKLVHNTTSSEETDAQPTQRFEKVVV